jgi:hypothetical protein
MTDVICKGSFSFFELVKIFICSPCPLMQLICIPIFLRLDQFGGMGGGGGGSGGFQQGGWNFKSNIDPEELFR